MYTLLAHRSYNDRLVYTNRHYTLPEALGHRAKPLAVPADVQGSWGTLFCMDPGGGCMPQWPGTSIDINNSCPHLLNPHISPVSTFPFIPNGVLRSIYTSQDPNISLNY